MSRPPLLHRLADRLQAAVNRLGDLWNSLVWPVESAIGRVGEFFFGAFDGFADFEALVIRLIGFVFWPFIAIGRWLGSWLPTTKADGTPSWIIRIPAWFGGFVFRLAERLNLDGVLVLLTRLTTPLWWPLISVIGWINAWLATRRPRELILAIPALVMAMPFAYVAAQASWRSQSIIESRYQVAAREAIEAGHYKLAELLERKLAQLGVDTRRTAYQTGLRLADEGDFEVATERMQSVAPSDQPGYPSAHLWLVQQLVKAPEEGEIPEASFLLAEQHLNRLAELKIENAGLAQTRAFVYLKLDRPRAAIETLAPYAFKVIDAAAMRLRLLAAGREQEGLGEQATSLLRLIENEKRSGELEPRWYEAWLLAAQIAGEQSEFEQAIEAWLEVDPEAERPRQLLSRFRREQAERLATDPTANPRRVAALLTEAIRLGVPVGWTDKTLGKMSPSGSPSLLERRVWELAIAESGTPATLLFSAATRAATSDAIEIARRGYATLAEKGEADANAWNNYAWTLLQEPEPAPEQSLEAVSKALAEKPNDHRFRETRGQTLLALDRWDEAIVDLEYALNGMPESPEVHAALATCYERLSKPQLAEIHRRQASR